MEITKSCNISRLKKNIKECSVYKKILKKHIDNIDITDGFDWNKHYNIIINITEDATYKLSGSITITRYKDFYYIDGLSIVTENKDKLLEVKSLNLGKKLICLGFCILYYMFPSITKIKFFALDNDYNKLVGVMNYQKTVSTADLTEFKLIKWYESLGFVYKPINNIIPLESEILNMEGDINVILHRCSNFIDTSSYI